MQTVLAISKSSSSVIEQILYKATPFRSKFSDGYHEVVTNTDAICPWMNCRRGMTYRQAACYIIDEAKQLITVDAGAERLINNSIRNDHLSNIDYRAPMVHSVSSFVAPNMKNCQVNVAVLYARSSIIW